MTESNSLDLVDADGDYINSLILRISGPEFDQLISEVRVIREHFQIEHALGDIVNDVHRRCVAAAA
jgi:hypothetical protein